LGDGECTPWTLPGPIFSSKLADTAENEHHQFSLKECNKNHQKIEIFENLPNSQGTSGMVKYHTKTPREAWVATLQLEKSEIFSKKNRKILARKIINLHERNEPQFAQSWASNVDGHYPHEWKAKSQFPSSRVIF